jgi:hypothetical protein
MTTASLRVSLALLLFVLFASQIESSAVSKRRKSGPTNGRDGLLLTAQLRKTVYHLDDEVQIDVELRNISDHDMRVYRGVTAGSYIWLQDWRGQSLVDRVISCFLTPPPYPEKDFVTIAPGDAIDGREVIAAPNYDITAPGRFYVTIGYSSPIFAQYTPKGARFWSRQDGDLRVGPLVFEFVQ